MLDRHVPSPGVPEFNRRFGWLVAIVAIAFVVLVGRLWQLQIIRGERYFQRSTDNFVKEQWLPAVRGRILDRKGVVLVDNRPSFNVYVTPRYATKPSLALLGKLAVLSDDDAHALVAKVEAQRSLDRFRPVLVLEDIDRDRFEAIDQAHNELPGVTARADEPHRTYPYGTLAAHVLGYMNRISEAELVEKHKDGYDDEDYVGRYGIERQWENYMRGKKGVERFVVDAKGQRKTGKEAEELVAEFGGEQEVSPVPGENVVLTVDADLQRIAERALRNHPAGGIAVVEVKTGRILALVSKPGFDPNVMTGHLKKEEQAAMEADPYKPFIDKTLHQHYYPGSTYKFVTAIAAIEDNLVDPDAKIVCRGELELAHRVFHCPKEHGPVDMVQALAQSCDVYFWSIAEKVGMDRLAEVARDFGFGAPTGLGLNGDVPGRVPWKEWYEKTGGFRIGYTLNTAIGQGDTEVTVLQLALAYAALANGGDLWVPQIVLRVETAGGRVVEEFAPKLRRHVKVSARTLQIVGRGLWGVVNDPKGTAYDTRLAEVTVAGKTGTAQVRKLVRGNDGAWNPYGDHAWFAGYAPADDPKIAFVVLIEHGGKGGHVAAPVAMEVVRGYFEQIVGLPGSGITVGGGGSPEPGVNVPGGGGADAGGTGTHP